MQVSLAMDAICRDLCDKRKGTSLAYLCTPTDLHLIPKEAHDAAAMNYKEFSKKMYCKHRDVLILSCCSRFSCANYFLHQFLYSGMLVKLLLGKRALRRNDKKPVEGVGGEFYYVNGISVAQGPNYGTNTTE